MNTIERIPEGERGGLRLEPHPKAPELLAVYRLWGGELLDTTPKLSLSVEDAAWLGAQLTAWAERPQNP